LINLLADFFDRERAVDATIVLALIIATEGSTYRKPGAFMLFSSRGERCGLLSGGCLEDDLQAHALRLIASEETVRIRHYDNRSSDDPIWGLGLGCEGSMTIALLQVGAEQAYQPLVTLFDATRRGTLYQHTLQLPEQAEPFVLRVDPPLQLLICGSGPDAEPLHDFATRLGWEVTLLDHRPAYLTADRFHRAKQLLRVDLEDWSKDINLDRFDAAVVMSHHLGADRRYLEQLAPSNIQYVGLLGPPARRERLLSELGATADQLRRRLHAPVGLDIGGRTPQAIALSIAAEIQSVFNPTAV
jgi:xanthine dehydrogenase accessory factor